VIQAATAPPPATDRPPLKTLAFITGCGRSGTTIIGRLLERHPSVRYLNDRFDLWIRPFPFTDAWGRHVKSAKAGARIALGERDANVPDAARNWFNGLFDHERGNRPVLVEKLAINNFRLGFVRALCPEACFINIIRHGVEVAFSIQQKVDLGHWYGQHDRKWTLLVEHAWANGYGPLVGLCKTAYHRGLLEWRMSVEAAEAYFAKDPSRALRLRYEQLIADPVETGRQLREFLGLEPDAEMERFAAEEIRRQNPEASQREIPPGTEEIAGETLRRLGYRI
jgi:hypothetical protein